MTASHEPSSPPTSSPPHEPSEPSDTFVGALVKEVRAIQDVVRGRFGELTPEQLAWSPEAGRWGVGLCLEHLLKTNHLYLKQMEPAVEALEPVSDPEKLVIRGNAFGRWFTRFVGPHSRWKLPAPGTFRPSKKKSGEEGSSASPTRTLDDVVPRFLAQHDRILALLEKAEGRPLDEARISSPATRLIRFRLSDGIRAMVAHDRRHLGQAERVLDHPDFPLNQDPGSLDLEGDPGQS